MSPYLVIETRDPFASREMTQTLRMIQDLIAQGNLVSLYLIQNGVFVARKSVQNPEFHEVIMNRRVQIFADDYSLEERGIQTSEMHNSIQVANASKLVSLMMEPGCKAIWN